MKSSTSDSRLYWLSYPLWILFCAVLFFVFRHGGNPARPSDRLDNPRAVAVALAYLQRADPVRYAGYDAVHVTQSKKGEAAKDPRWLVLCDRKERSSFQDAIVVEVSALDGGIRDVRRIDPRTAALAEPAAPGAPLR